MRRRARQSVGKKQILMATWHAVIKWLKILAPVIRVLILTVLMNVLIFHTVSIVIPVFGFRLSQLVMHNVTMGTHIVLLMWIMQDDYSWGWLFELSRMMLAAELVLFVYFMQYRFWTACIILGVYIAGAAALWVYGSLRFEHLFMVGALPQQLVRDAVLKKGRGMQPGDLVAAAIRRYLVVGAALLLAVPAALTVFVYGMDGAMERGSVHAVVREEEPNQMMANLDAIRLLERGSWASLSVQEKIDVLQIIADIETRHMSIEPVSVVNYHLEGITGGAYDHTQRQARIDMQKLEGYPPLEYIETILHECRHAFQHDCVDSLDWNDPQVQNGIYYQQVRRWRHENEHYVSCNEDIDVYQEQDVERDARLYAQEGLEIYDRYILLSNLPGR